LILKTPGLRPCFPPSYSLSSSSSTGTTGTTQQERHWLGQQRPASQMLPPNCAAGDVQPNLRALRLRLDFISVLKPQLPIRLHQDRGQPFIQHSERHTSSGDRGYRLDVLGFNRSGRAGSKGRVKEAEQTPHLTLSLSSLHLPPPCCLSLPLVRCHITTMMRTPWPQTGSVSSSQSHTQENRRPSTLRNLLKVILHLSGRARIQTSLSGPEACILNPTMPSRLPYSQDPIYLQFWV